MGFFEKVFSSVFEDEPIPPRPVRSYERYPGLGPLRWWDKVGPETFSCRACGHQTRSWRGMQTHCRRDGHRRPASGVHPFTHPGGAT